MPPVQHHLPLLITLPVCLLVSHLFSSPASSVASDSVLGALVSGSSEREPQCMCVSVGDLRERQGEQEMCVTSAVSVSVAKMGETTGE